MLAFREEVADQLPLSSIPDFSIELLLKEDLFDCTLVLLKSFKRLNCQITN